MLKILIAAPDHTDDLLLDSKIRERIFDLIGPIIQLAPQHAATLLGDPRIRATIENLRLMGDIVYHAPQSAKHAILLSRDV